MEKILNKLESRYRTQEKKIRMKTFSDIELIRIFGKLDAIKEVRAELKKH